MQDLTSTTPRATNGANASRLSPPGGSEGNVLPAPPRCRQKKNMTSHEILCVTMHRPFQKNDAHTSDGALVPSRAVFGTRSDFESADVFPAPVRTGLGTVRPALPRCPALWFIWPWGLLSVVFLAPPKLSRHVMASRDNATACTWPRVLPQEGAFRGFGS